MVPSHEEFTARRVVTGVDEAGRSTVVSDAVTPARIVTPGNTKCDIWRFAQLPASNMGPDGLDVGVVTIPPDGGLVYRVVAMPPDSTWDKSLGYFDSRGPVGPIPGEQQGGIPGLHATPTLDILTVVSGEIWAILETREVRLRPGDTLVQRGTKHSWANRTDRTAVYVSIMVSAPEEGAH
jgi:hypothetical protein